MEIAQNARSAIRIAQIRYAISVSVVVGCSRTMGSEDAQHAEGDEPTHTRSEREIADEYRGAAGRQAHISEHGDRPGDQPRDVTAGKWD